MVLKLNRMLKKQFIFRFLTLALCFYFPFALYGTEAQGTPPPSEQFVVVLDAGHGGKDPGNRGNGYFEKKIALSIALQIGKILEKHKDIKVLYTRKTDKYIDLIERANIANRADADLFVSIHCDAHTSQAYGAGTFVLGLHANQRNFEVARKENSVIFFEDNYEAKYEGFDPNNPEAVIGLTLMQETYLDQSIVAAAAIQKRFVRNLGRKDRTVKQAGFIVLKYSYMPSVLVETGFLTNRKEGAYLNSKKGQSQMASTIAQAIVDYKSDLQTNIADVSSSLPPAEETVSDTAAQPTTTAVTFKVQIAASRKAVATKSYNFKGLKDITRSKEGKLYRYYYGASSSYNQAKRALSKAKRKGYKEAFIVAFKNGKKVPLKNVL